MKQPRRDAGNDKPYKNPPSFVHGSRWPLAFLHEGGTLKLITLSPREDNAALGRSS